MMAHFRLYSIGEAILDRWLGAAGMGAMLAIYMEEVLVSASGNPCASTTREIQPVGNQSDGPQRKICDKLF